MAVSAAENAPAYREGQGTPSYPAGSERTAPVMRDIGRLAVALSLTLALGLGLGMALGDVLTLLPR